MRTNEISYKTTGSEYMFYMYFVKNLPKTQYRRILGKLAEQGFEPLGVPTREAILSEGADFDLLVKKDDKIYPVEIKQLWSPTGVYLTKKPGQHNNIIIYYKDSLYSLKSDYKNEIMALGVYYKKYKNVYSPYDTKPDIPILPFEEASEKILEQVITDFDEDKLQPLQKRVTKLVAYNRSPKDFRRKDFVGYKYLEQTHIDNATLLDYGITPSDPLLRKRAYEINPKPKPARFRLLEE